MPLLSPSEAGNEKDWTGSRDRWKSSRITIDLVLGETIKQRGSWHCDINFHHSTDLYSEGGQDVQSVPS